MYYKIKIDKMISVFSIIFTYRILPFSIFGISLISLIIYLATSHQTHSIIRYIGFLASGLLLITFVIYLSIVFLLWQFEYSSDLFLFIFRYFPIFLIGIVFLFQGMFYFKCEKKKESPTKEDINFYGIMWIIISIINHFSFLIYVWFSTYPRPSSTTISLGLFVYPLFFVNYYVIVLIIFGIYMITYKEW